MPGLGQTVLYTLTPADARLITDLRARAEQAATVWPHATGPTGAPVHAGDTFPAVVVRVVSLDGPINLQVLLDGNHAYWAQHIEQGTTPGHWAWPDL